MGIEADNKEGVVTVVSVPTKQPCMHCTEPMFNTYSRLCSAHLDMLIELQRQQHEIVLEIEKIRHKYIIFDGPLPIDYEDCGRWRSYEVQDACGETEEEFLNNVSISEIDQDGGEIRTYGYDDAGSAVQNCIDKLAGLKRE